MQNDGIGEPSSISSPAILPPKRPRDEGSSSQEDEFDANGINLVTPLERRKLKADFRAEAKQARASFKATLTQEWLLAHPLTEDKENSGNDCPPVTAEGSSDDGYDFDYFVSLRMGAYDRWAAEGKATLLSSLVPKPIRPDPDQSPQSIRLRQDRVKALWEGLRRRFFGETEGEPELDLEGGNHSGIEASLQESNRALRQEIDSLMERLRRRGVRVPDEPPSLSLGMRDNEPDDPGAATDGHQGQPPTDFQPPGRANGNRQQSSSSARPPSPRMEGKSPPRRSRRLERKGEVPIPPVVPSTGTHRIVSDRFFYEPSPQNKNDSAASDLSTNGSALIAQDRQNAASSKEGISSDGFSLANQNSLQNKEGFDGFSQTNHESPKVPDGFSLTNHQSPNTLNASSLTTPNSRCDLNEIERSFVDPHDAMVGSLPFIEDPSAVPTTKRKILLSMRTLRKVLTDRNTVFSSIVACLHLLVLL